MPPPPSMHQGEQFPSMPVRHTRPMTPAELHLELEKEQEAVVNRLTRELSALRAHSASVASNASQASSHSAAVYDPPHEPPSIHSTSPSLHHQSLHTPQQHPHHHIIACPTLPTSARLHRSSSSSLGSRTRSLTSSSSSFAQPPSAASIAPPPGPAPLGNTSQASVDRARDATGGAASSSTNVAPSADQLTRSRQNSVVQRSPSRPHSQVLQRSAGPSPEPWSVSGPTAGLGVAAPRSVPPPVHHGAGGVSLSRLEEAAQARSGLENARAENELLVKRLKELEGTLRGLRRERNGDASEDERGRSGIRGRDTVAGAVSVGGAGDSAARQQ